MTIRAKRTRSKRSRVPRRKTPESLVASQITDYLTAHQIRYRRNQVGRARFGNRYVAFGEKGQADYTAYIPAKEPRTFYILNIETKSEEGRLSYDQKIWRQGVEASGEFYVAAKSYEPIEEFLKEKKSP